MLKRHYVLILRSSYISTSFRSAAESNHQNEKEPTIHVLSPLDRSDILSVEEKISFWDTVPETEFDPLGDEIIEDDADDSFDFPIDHLAKFHKRYEFLKESKEYQWLLHRIRTSANLSQSGNTILANISRKIHAGLDESDVLKCKQRAKAFKSNTLFTAIFHVGLSLRTFLDHYYQDHSCSDIGAVLTLTGDAVNSQAATCAQYMQQTWPISGIEILRVLERSLSKNAADPYKCDILFLINISKLIR